MILAKISYGLGGTFMAASGASRIPWENFIEYVVSLNLIRSSLLLAVGFYFGKVALLLWPTYLKYYTLAIVILVPLGYFIYHKYYRKFEKLQ
jgi:membrane protein DedA with SNARE-associated domain